MISWLIISYLGYIMLGGATQTISPVWPSIAANLNIDITAIGIIMGVYLAFYVVSLPLSSIGIEKIGVKNNLSLGSTLLGVASICFAFGNNLIFLFLSITILGIGAAIIDTTSNYYLALKYNPKFLSWLHCMWAVGSTVGITFFATLMKNNISYQVGFSVIGVVSIILGITIFIYKHFEDSNKENNSKENKVTKKKKPKVDFISIIKMKYVILFLCCMFFIDFIPNIFAIWYTSFSTKILNRTLSFSSYVVSVFFIGQVASRILSGFIVEKLGSWKVVRISIALVMIASLLSLFYNKNIIIFIMAFTLGFGVGPFYPLFMDIAKNIFGIEQLRGVVGLSGSFAKLGGFMASVFIGFLINIFSFECFLKVLIIASILALVLFNSLYYYTNKKEKAIK